MTFKFICPRCGEYEVDQNTFMAVLTPELQQAVTERMESNPDQTVVAAYDTGCQHEGCEPNIEHEIELRARS